MHPPQTNTPVVYEVAIDLFARTGQSPESADDVATGLLPRAAEVVPA